VKSLTIILTLIAHFCFAISDTLYINKGELVINGSSTAFCSFNTSDSLTPHNKNFQNLVQDTLELTVLNNDTLDHSFTIDGVINETITAQTSSNIKIKFSETGTYLYYSDRSYGNLIGASGIISVVNTPDIHYYWNLYEVESALSFNLANQTVSTISFANYTPNIFSINGFSYPNTTTDSTGHVQQNTGDTIYISIINSGNIEHTLHFHGYHVTIIDAKKSVGMINWIKDTFPLKRQEAMTIMLVPQQAGIFPVHDHNLINVTNAGLYPGGMLTVLNIQ